MIELSAGLNHGIEGLFDNISVLPIKHPVVGILIAHLIVVRKVKHMRTELREVVGGAVFTTVGCRLGPNAFEIDTFCSTLKKVSQISWDEIILSLVIQNALRP